MTPNTFLLIGLGNPGREYKDTRHNFGFMAIDRLAVRLNAQGMKVQSKAIVTTAVYEDHKLILAKPQTFMNLSGQSVQGLAHFYKIPNEKLMILSDDLDIPFVNTLLAEGALVVGEQRCLIELWDVRLPAHPRRQKRVASGRVHHDGSPDLGRL